MTIELIIVKVYGIVTSMNYMWGKGQIFHMRLPEIWYLTC